MRSPAPGSVLSTALGKNTKTTKKSPSPQKTNKKPRTTKNPKLKTTKKPKNTMFKTVSYQGQVGIRSMLRDGIVHSYVLNDAKAIKVMVTNAALPPISAPDQTLQTSQLQLSTGAFSLLVQNLFTYWNSFDLSQGQGLVEGDTKVILMDVRCGTEVSDKLVVALAKFTFKEKSISFFGYYTNQSIMVQGKYHDEFLNLFIHALLAKLIAQT